MRAALLVADQDVMQLRVVGQIAVEPEVGSARVPEDGVDTLTDERLEGDLRAGEQARGLRRAVRQRRRGRDRPRATIRSGADHW